jgi:hypothetical protein
MELGIRLSFIKTSEFRGVVWTPQTHAPRYATEDFFSFQMSLREQRVERACCRTTRTIQYAFHYISHCKVLCFIRTTWTNRMHYFLLIYFNSKPLHVSSRLAAHHQEDQLCINSNWYSHALCWLAAGCASQHNAWLYQLLYIHSWFSRWWAISLLETCRGLLLK